jgi:pimeloyl-ACP methyl ester carboxylesterase
VIGRRTVVRGSLPARQRQGLCRMLATWLLCILLAACAELQPSLGTLYRTSNILAGQPPVILVHGAYGGRLCEDGGREIWPGGLLDLLFENYNDLGLPLTNTDASNVSRLQVCGLADTVAGQDFYGRIEATLTSHGGYELTEAGSPVASGARRYYRFVYDWRRDNQATAAALDKLVDQIRIDYAQPELQVDIVAHSMGGLVTRYWLRYGSTDVLNDNNFLLDNITFQDNLLHILLSR